MKAKQTQKYKTLRFKDTKEFAQIYVRELYSSEIPQILMSMWDMQSYVEHQWEHDTKSIILMTRMMNECEMVDLEILTPE